MSFIKSLIKKSIRQFKAEQESNYLALDTETTGLELLHGCKPFFVGTCDSSGTIKYWEWKVNPLTREPIIPEQDRIALVKHIRGKTLIFHNASFDITALETIGIKLSFSRDNLHSNPKRHKLSVNQIYLARCNTFHDTQIASHAFRTSDPRGLKELALLHLNYSDKDERRLKEELDKANRYTQKPP